VAEKLSGLSQTLGKKASYGDGPLPLRQVRLEGLALPADLAQRVNFRLYGRQTQSLKDKILRVMTLSARNRLEGKITELQLGGVMAHVVLQVGDNVIESVITKRSAVEMGLKVGDTVSAVIKSTEIMLEKK
jgi:molybdopterin-binding protein